ncbi:MAG: hypothetical protein Q9184_005813 [Pyrenodesmia sp. 2 TL-2023]
MNRFRSRKKSLHDASDEPLRRPSAESDIPALPKFSSKTFRRNKKNQPEPKPQVDLINALPPSDDFRTSLLMPNLSARFSMLREQDDPHSKLGKANDDSVLFPKRASRFDIFNTGPLNGISEDDSIHAPIRPPFASSRTESYGSDGSYWTDEDRSMMSRARPGEGNTMFGGRQKIYKIPVGASGSTKSFGNDEHQSRGGMGGRALYGDDLAESTFPTKVEEDIYGNKQPQADKDAQGRSSDERSNSPPFTKYNHNRETTSSTNSGPSGGRTSTAATSVASQRSVYGAHGVNGVAHTTSQNHGHPPVSDRPPPKSRRLYGQGLDQHIYEQQYSAMNRLESLHRQRTNGATPPGRLQGSRSATNLNDRSQHSGAVSPSLTSPAPNMQEFDLGLMPETSDVHVDSGHGKSPPLSPPMSPVHDNTFTASLEPNDLGKATASGAFNKPSKQYNEQQYLQRQLQLQQGRESPSLVRPFSPLANSIDEQVVGRTRDNSLAGPQPHAASLLRGRERSTSNLRNAETQNPATRHPDDQYNPTMDNSFLSNLSSEIGTPVESDNEQGLFPLNALYQTPMNSSSMRDGQRRHSPEDSSEFKQLNDNDRHVKFPEESISDSRSEVTVTEQQPNSGVPKVTTDHVDADSPTLGPTTGMTSVNGLNGLVRAHLRNESGQSSIYPEPSPKVPSRFPDDAHHPAYNIQPTMNGATSFFRDSTFQPEEPVPPRHPAPPSDTSEITPSLSVRARQMLNQAAALRDNSPKVQQMYGDNKAQRILGGEAPRPSYENPIAWQDQLRAHHTRGGSTETEKEREGLANELAERRRAVQDKLQSFVENESRSSSPAPGSRVPGANQKRIPFGILKSKTSRDSLASKQEHPSKAMKMLGIGPNSIMSNGSPRPSQDENFSRPQPREQRQAQNDVRGPQPRIRTQGKRNQRPESRPDSSEKEPSPPESRSSRERSGSENSDKRFGNRNSKPKNDDLIEEEVSGSNHISPPSKTRPKEYSDAPRPVEELMASMATHQPLPERSQSAMSGRFRSNSKTVSPGYFDGRDVLSSVQPNAPYLTHSPSTPDYSVRSAPSMYEHPSMMRNESVPVMIPPKSPHGAYGSPKHYRYVHKDSINKHDISEPVFRSCTSSVEVVDLPAGASLRNGMDPAPPIPPLNPRRKRTQTLLQALGRLENSHPIPSSMKPAPYNDQNSFPADESSFRRHRLRKSSSEGGHMNVKARQQATIAPSPAVPNFSQTMSARQSPVRTRFPPHRVIPPRMMHPPPRYILMTLSLSDPLPPWIPEIPPPGFVVDFSYISRTRDLDKFSVWLNIVSTMAKGAINYWNQELPHLIIMPEFHNIAVHIVSFANRPPGYQTKSLIWTLQAAFDQYINRGQYSSASLTSRVNNHALGSISLRSTLTNSRHQATIDPPPPPQLSPRRRGLTIRLEYKLHGAIFTDQGFFYTVINMLVYAANGDPKTRGMDGINLYNSEEDYSLRVEPMSPDATEELPLIMVIRILGGLPEVMYAQRRGGRWAELRGTVKWDGVNIGRVLIKKGQPEREGCLRSTL